MLKRVSNVESVNVITVNSASQLQIGDAMEIDLKSNVLAIVRDAEIWTGNEGDLKRFNIYWRPVVLPPIIEPIIVKTQNVNSQIKVGKIDILGVVNASLAQIGSNEHMFLDTRRKHIRHLTIPPKEPVK